MSDQPDKTIMEMGLDELRVKLTAAEQERDRTRTDYDTEAEVRTVTKSS